jgi:hypothetical protein
MQLTEQTKTELRAIREGIELPGEYIQFMVRWIAFNRAFNELRSEPEETARVLAIGDDLHGHWKEIIPQIRRLVALECVGADRLPHQTLLRPNRPVKSATIFLRVRLSIMPGYPECTLNQRFCRESKISMCRPVDVEPWDRSELTAVLRIIYQVRCNLFHGENQFIVPDIQTNQDRELLATANEILNSIFGWLV